MAGIGIGYGYGLRKKMGVAYDAVAAAYFAAVPNAFSAARKTIINTLIAGLRSDGNLTKLDRLWLFANSTTGNAVIDVINLSSVTLVNIPTFAADQGYNGNGVTSYMNTNFNPSVNGVNLTQNSGTIFVYVRDNDVSVTGGNTGVYDGTKGMELMARYNSGTVGYTYINANPSSEFSFTSNDARGLTVSQRSASNLTTVYKNGVSVITNAGVSTALANRDLYALGENVNGLLSYMSLQQLAILGVGSGTIDQAALYTRIQTYMTSLGTQV